MARGLRRVGGYFFSAFFLVGLTLLGSGGVRADNGRDGTREKVDRDAEFARFVESTTASIPARRAAKIETVAATCDPTRARAARLDEIQKVQQRFFEMQRRQLLRAAEGKGGQIDATAGDTAARGGSEETSKQ